MAAALPAIRESAALHLAHITKGGDPFEALEARPLDYGHWSAHRLEAMTGFAVRHGEAVGIGVAVDTVYSSLVHGLPAADAARVLHALRALGLPLDHPQVHDTDALFAGLEEFRQHLGGRLTLTMLRGVGDPVEAHEVDKPAMLEAIARVREAGGRAGASRNRGALAPLRPLLARVTDLKRVRTPDGPAFRLQPPAGWLCSYHPPARAPPRVRDHPPSVPHQQDASA